jgi:hypothetical protein
VTWLTISAAFESFGKPGAEELFVSLTESYGDLDQYDRECRYPGCHTGEGQRARRERPSTGHGRGDGHGEADEDEAPGQAQPQGAEDPCERVPGERAEELTAAARRTEAGMHDWAPGVAARR